MNLPSNAGEHSPPGELDRAEALDTGGLDVIDERECWRLLASQAVGRVAVIVGHYPQVFPVNHIVDGHSILFRTGVGTKLWAIGRSNVTFEVDEIDPENRTGWSVMVRGSAREVDLSRDVGVVVGPESARAAIGDLPWAPGDRDHVVRIIADAVSGRRIHVAEPPPKGT
jgi:nitroimidazol reductase NimA-like FMN-containing flavoprotein (pyridoxamine 5'-phosphate oxidase superfamily)